MKKNVDKHFVCTREEAEDLQKKAGQVCMSEGSLIRLLIKGFHPKEKPDDRFYDCMRELYSISNNLNQLVAKANSLGFVDAGQLSKEIKQWHRFQNDIEKKYLEPDGSTVKWQ